MQCVSGAYHVFIMQVFKYNAKIFVIVVVVPRVFKTVLCQKRFNVGDVNDIGCPDKRLFYNGIEHLAFDEEA